MTTVAVATPMAQAWSRRGFFGQSPPPASRRLNVVTLGRLDYLEAWALQQRYAQERKAGRIGDTLLLAQHPHTLCTGVLGKDAHVLIGSAEREALSLPYYRVDRGGDVMYVGPGHLVAYAIVALTGLGLDPIQYVRLLEQAVMETLADFGIHAHRINGLTGVWVDGAKIAGVAIKVSQGVTTHGFNLNVNPDLSYYGYIVTCGNRGREVTSMERLLGRPVPMGQVEAAVIAHMEECMGSVRP